MADDAEAGTDPTRVVVLVRRGVKVDDLGLERAPLLVSMSV